MDWYDITGKYHEQTFAHDCRLSSLREEWQRELAALWRLEADVNNGAYLQFFVNWGRESYVYASQGLGKMGAGRVAFIVNSCQALIDEHFDDPGASQDERRCLLRARVIGRDGELIKEAGSILPDSVLDRIEQLSYEFMDYPENLAELGLKYYRPHLG